MYKNILSVVGITILFLGTCITPSVAINNGKKSIIPPIDSRIITVDNEGDGDYINIQEALDNANEGDIIKVYSGIYESIDIEKTIVLEGISHEFENGSDTGKPVLIGRNNNDRPIQLDCVNDCVIQGFELCIGRYGILVYSSSNNILSDNNISKCEQGIHGDTILGPSSDNIIENNYITDNIYYGIHLEHVKNNTIRYNVITHNGEKGIYLFDTNGTKIHNNHISHNGPIIFRHINNAGISIYSSSDTIIEKNQFEYNSNGIFIAGAEDTIVRCNNFLRNFDKEVYTVFTLTTVWENNYWKRPRFLPKPVLVLKGYLYLPPDYYWGLRIHCIQFDWRPAKEPYDI
jgi:parallel beta-helix repeat protein